MFITTNIIGLVNIYESFKSVFSSSKYYSNVITSTIKLHPSSELILLAIELLCDTGANWFMVNDPSYLHNLVASTDTVGVTRGSSAFVDFKGTLYLLLETDNTKLLIQIKNVPCIKTNPYSGLPLTPFKDYGFK